MPNAPVDGDEIPVCERCGRQHARVQQGHLIPTCTAHKSNGLPCMRYPVKGAHVCPFHGGNARHVRQAAADRAEMANVTRRLTAELASANMDTPYEDPIQTLLWLVSTSAQAVRWLAERMAELDTPDVTDPAPLADVVGIDEDGQPIMRQPWAKLYGRTNTGDLGPHPLWTKWNEERDRLARYSKMAVDAGVSERMVRIAEAQGVAVASVVIEALTELNLPPDVRSRAQVIIGEKFRSMGPGLGAIEAVARKV